MEIPGYVALPEMELLLHDVLEARRSLRGEVVPFYRPEGGMAIKDSTLNLGCLATAAFTAAWTEAVNLANEIDVACAIVVPPA
jgi:hypothetical protein